LNTGAKEVLQEGTIFTIEPGIYIPSFGGVRIEDMVYLNKNAVRTLTRFPRHFIEVKV
jgi:Xaa-Pro aminopeptidase